MVSRGNQGSVSVRMPWFRLRCVLFLSRDWVYLLWITCMWDHVALRSAAACPALCTCTMKNSADDASLPTQRIVCAENQAISSLNQLELDSLPSNTFLLDLSQDSLTTIPKGSFHGLNALQKLNLKNNKIISIEPGAFEGLTNLEKLDLSGNKLTSINKTIFEGMPNLEKLSLSGNELKVIHEGTFDGLSKLKRLDFDSDYLMCDCHLEWIVKWMKNNVRINSGTTCAVPSQLKGRAIKNLKRKDLHCDWPVELPLFELVPSTNQVVFEGDRLPFSCRASVVDSSMRLYWVRNDVPLMANSTHNLNVVTQYSPDMTEMTTSLIVHNLKVKDSGVWTCFVHTPRGNVSKDVNIVVMSDSTIYCAPTFTTTNKGVFHWPKIVSGVRVDLPCPAGSSSSYTGSTKPPHAFYTCDKTGTWTQLDTSQCQFTSEVTRVLEQYAKADLNNMTKLVNRLDQLKLYINTARTITDKMDVIYLSAIVETLSHQVRNNEKLSDIILELVSIVMESSPELLADAQKDNQACTRLVRAVEELPKQLLSHKRRLVAKHVRNIALFAHTVNPDTFQSTSCVAFRPTNAERVYSDNSFFCSPQENFTLTDPAKYMHMGDKEVEAFIHIPASVLQTVRCVYPVCSDNTFTLQFITYRNARLFPIIHRHRYNQPPLLITTNVISAKIVGVSVVENLTEPVVVSLVTRKPGIFYKGVYWDFLLQDGWGGWDTQGCSVHQQVGNITTMSCNHLTNFAILQSPMTAATHRATWYKYMFTMPAPVYAGSGVLVLCTLAVFCTIAGCHSDLKMPGKAKHSVANLCLSLMLLTLTFTLGIRMTVHVMACQIIGIALHYFSISTIFWIIITSYNMYKKFVKAERPMAPPIEPLDGPPVPKPMLRFYLIGWGIAVIVCGITAAVNLTSYAENKPFCFLSLEPSVGAILVPACILISINIIFFICICCVVRGSAGRGSGGHPLDEPETEEVNELELTNQEMESLPTQSHTSNLTAATSLMDLEYRPVSQLRAVVTVLLLYLLTWVSAALLVTQPFTSLPYQHVVFTYTYAVLAALLGLVILIFYCLGREDARETWRRCFSCERAKRPYTMTSTGSGPHMTHMNGHIANSHTSLNSSFTNKSSNANNQSQPMRYAQKKPTSNINLLPSHPATATEVSLSSVQDPNVPVFYNPRQNGIAKRYWERHRQKNHLNLLQKEAALSDTNRSNHSYHNHSGTNSGGNNYQSQGGNSSDANTHLSIEIQIKSRPRSGTYSPKTVSSEVTSQAQPGFSSLPRLSQRSGYSPLTVQTNHTPLLMPVSQLHQHSPHSGYSSGSPAAGVHGVNPISPATQNHVMGKTTANIITPRVNGYYVPASSVSVYPALPPPPSYAYPANSVGSTSSNEAGLLGGGGATLTSAHNNNNNTLPRVGSSYHQHPHHTVSQYPLQPKMGGVSQLMQRNGSVPRLRDADGQSAVSSSTNYSTAHPIAMLTTHTALSQERLPSVCADIQNMEMYKPPIPPVINAPLPPLQANNGTRRTEQGCMEPTDSATAVDTEQEEEDDRSVDAPVELSVAPDDVLPVEGAPRSAAGSECGTNSSSRWRKKESFMDELEQRIPHNKVGSSPALSRSTLGGSLDRATRSRPTSMGSENSQQSGQSRRSHSHSTHSETDSAHQPHHQGSGGNRPPPRSRSHDSHESAKSSRESHDSGPQQSAGSASRTARHHRRHRHHNGRRSSRSLPGKDKAVWEGANYTEQHEGDNNKERGKPPPYVYVNHSYQEKVMNKLLQQNPNGMVEPIARGLSWFPRSVSAYEQVANADDLDLDDSSTSSSSDDSTDDIWVLQKNKKKKKFKKETSV